MSLSSLPRVCRDFAVKGLAGLALSVLGLAAVPAFGHGADAYTLDFTKAPPGVLPWGQLAKVGVQRAGGHISVQFLPPVLALEGTLVTLYGYMTPIAPAAMHKRFLFSMQPLACQDCTPPTPDGIVEVNVKQAEPTSTEPLAVRGTLVLVRDDPQGAIYRLVDAAVVRTGK